MLAGEHQPFAFGTAKTSLIFSVCLGLGRIVALHHHESTLYQIG